MSVVFPRLVARTPLASEGNQFDRQGQTTYAINVNIFTRLIITC
jgi:hypothetical protein